MRRKIGILISCVATVCITFSFLIHLTNFMEVKTSHIKYADFFEQKEDFDVLFLGTSHMINAVYPMELWNDYGIVSYNMGGHANELATSYWVMKNAFDYTEPKVVVVDCLKLEKNWKCSEVFSYVHMSFDAFPFSITKVKAVWDLLDDPVLEEYLKNEENAEESNAEQRTKLGLLWNYSVYHARWKELVQEDFAPGNNCEKGAETRNGVTPGNFERIDPKQKMEAGTVGEYYLRKIIEECKERGIAVVLTHLPLTASETEQMAANYVYDLAQESGVDYINFLDLNVVDYNTDLYDEIGHLNASGARKVSDYLGKYLIEHYNIADHRNNENYDFWKEDYAEYVEYKNQNLLSQEYIVEYLMMLSGDDLDIVMDIRNKDIFKNGWIRDLLSNLGVEEEKLSEKTDFIIIKRGGEKTILINEFRKDGELLETELGEVKFVYSADRNEQGESTGEYGLYIDDSLAFAGNENDGASLRIFVRRGETILDNVKFVYSVDPESTKIHVSEVSR